MRYMQISFKLLFDLFLAFGYDLFDFFVLRWTKRRKSVLGRVVVIMGGAGAIGKNVGKKLIDLGAKVLLADIDENALKIAEREFSVKTYLMDCTDENSSHKLARKVLTDPDLGSIDILILSAGYLVAKPILDMKSDEICKTMNVNLLSNFWSVRAFLPKMLETGSGHIVSICSVAAHLGLAYSTAYSKSGQRGFMQALTHELKIIGKSSNNIKTTTIHPFFVDTPLLKDLTPSSRFLDILTVEYAAKGVVDAILWEKEEAFVPSYIPLLLLLTKSPKSIKTVWDKFFQVGYYKYGYQANN